MASAQTNPQAVLHRMAVARPPDLSTRLENRMTLTARDIEDRLEEAACTLRRLPEKDRPRC